MPLVTLTLFWISGNVCTGFKARIELLTCVPLEFCSDGSTDSPLNATPADLLAASIVGQSLAWPVCGQYS